MYISVTDHAIKQVITRTNCSNEAAAKKFIVHLFRELYDLKKANQTYKGRRIKILSKDDGKFLLTDSVHKFIFAKEIGEVIVVTYSKKTQSDKTVHMFMKYFS